MPKVSDEYKAARRSQILSAARSCFARYGFQSTTIRDIERASELSSGAIFNYFSSKLDMFLALATEDAARTAKLWALGGLRRVIEAGNTPQSYRASYLEVGRELLDDSDFRLRWEDRGRVVTDAVRDHIRESDAAGRLRSNLDLDALLTFCIASLDGFLLQLRLGASAQELDRALSIYEDAIFSAPSE